MPALGRSGSCPSRGSLRSPSAGSRLGLGTRMTAVHSRKRRECAGALVGEHGKLCEQQPLPGRCGVAQATHPERTRAVDIAAKRVGRWRAAAGVRHRHEAFLVRAATRVVGGGSRRLLSEVAGRLRVPLADILPHVREAVGRTDREFRNADGRRRRPADRAHPRIQIVRTCTPTRSRRAHAKQPGVPRKHTRAALNAPGPGVTCFFFLRRGAGIVFGRGILRPQHQQHHEQQLQADVGGPGVNCSRPVAVRLFGSVVQSSGRCSFPGVQAYTSFQSIIRTKTDQIVVFVLK